MYMPPHNKILIVGDAGRGKTTLAEKLSKQLGIPWCSTDDYFWKVKFTEPNDRQKSEQEISEVYKRSQWIVEGTTRRLFQEGLEKADIIYLLEFKSIIFQYYFLIKRSFTRKHERLIDLYRLIRHVTYKRYKKNYGNHLPPLRDMLKPYSSKVVTLNSVKEIDSVFFEG